jgi:hypothetical protein
LGLTYSNAIFDRWLGSFKHIRYRRFGIQRNSPFNFVVLLRIILAKETIKDVDFACFSTRSYHFIKPRLAKYEYLRTNKYKVIVHLTKGSTRLSAFPGWGKYKHSSFE